MKKAIRALFVLFFLIFTVSGALAAEKKRKPEIKTVDNYIAIFDFEVTTGDKGISRPLADSVIHEFSQSDKYEVIDRGNMNKILKEQKFQMSGCVAQECKVDAGQILGVGKIVNGSVGKMGKTYYLTLQLIDVQTGKVELSAEDKCKCELDELLDSTKRLAKKLLGEKVDQSVEFAAKAKTEEMERVKVEQTAKAKAEAEAAARTEAAARARAEEMERVKAAEIAKAKAAGPEQKIINSIGMTFVYIKPGTFMMGSPSGEQGRDSDETQHQVMLTRGYYMGETEVAVGQWRTFARDSGYRTEAETGGGAYVWTGKWEKKEGAYWDNPGFAQSDNHPVTCVSWNDVQEYIKWLNRKEGSNRYRLPTEAEWEYAARAGSESAFSGGGITKTDCAHDPVLNALGWYCGNADKKTHPVAQKNSNSWGLYDMHGNVWEWVQDWKGDYPSGSVTDPTGPSSGSNRVFRGGGWVNDARLCRSADRGGDTPDRRSDSLGFRLSRTP